MARVVLTQKVHPVSPEGAGPGKRAEYLDALMPGMALRVSDKGHRSYVLIARFPLHPKHPARRTIGQVGPVTLDEARETARNWLRLIKVGIDPSVELEKERAANRRAQAMNFGRVATEFMSRHTDKKAKPKEARRVIENEFIRRWGPRPVTDIQPEEVAVAIRAIAKRSAAMAHVSFSYLRRMYSWALGMHEFGLDRSPLERLKPLDLIGKRVVRERVLTDEELKAVWDAAVQMGYPFGCIVRMLILTGARLNEVAALSWSEIDMTKQVITMPAKRMKGDREHAIPLAPMAFGLLQSLPRFRGPFVFTSTHGAKPYTGVAKAKSRIDKLAGCQGWGCQTYERTMRSSLSVRPETLRVI